MSNRRRPRKSLKPWNTRDLLVRVLPPSTTSGCYKRRQRSIRRQAWVAYGVHSTFADRGAGGQQS